MKLWIGMADYTGNAINSFEASLRDSVSLMRQNGIEVVDIDVVTGCCYLPLARNRLVRNFMDSNADYFMFLDTDLSWNPIQMMSFLQTDACFLAGVYPKKAKTREYPCQLFCEPPNYYPMVKNGLILASDVPTGFMRLDRSVFETMIDYYEDELEIDEPDENFQLKFSYWNFFDCVKIGRRWIGEDYNFCRIWRGLGGDIWIYPDITFGHWTADGSNAVFGNYHEYMIRRPGGVKSGPVNAVDYSGNDIDGWMTDVELGFLYQESSKYNSVVEIGSYKGRSSHALLSGLAKKVICIDPWSYFSQAENVYSGEGEYQEFKRNIESTFGENGRLRVIRDTSLSASKEVGDVDMVFIDGDHEYSAVRADIDAWLPKAKKLICGHDYGYPWPGVVKAVDETFGDRVKQIDSIWYVELDQ